MLTIIFSWIILFLVIFLIGRLVLKPGLLLFLNIQGDITWFEYFWVGLTVIFAILQIWSFFLPVNIWSLTFALVLSIVSLLAIFKKGFNLPKINIRFILISVLLLLIISYFASLSGGWPDTYGYHLNSVRWSSLYKVVPGLANLHTRLGFNSSFFPFASMIDNLFLKDRSTHIALSLMTAVLSIEFLWIFLKSKDKYLKIFILLTLPIFVEGIVRTVQVSSLSNDFALLITVLAICIELIRGDKKSIFIAAILSMMLVTVKLSGVVFSLVVIGFVLYKLALRRSESIRAFPPLILIGIIFLAPYVIRNIILSGWPLYPLPVLGLNVPWAVPYGRVVVLYEVIKAWAILPGVQWHSVVGMPFIQWFPGWFLRNLSAIELKIFFLTLLFFMLSILVKFINKKTIKQNTGLVVCGLASLASIFYLLFTAPDLRFGGIYFWTFFASVGSFFFTGIFKKNYNFEKFLIIFSIFLIVYVSWPLRLDSRIMLRAIRWDQSQAPNQILITPKDGSPAFKVYSPGPSGSCGNSELPCTPEIYNDFKEIVPGDISKGFATVK